MGLKLDLGCGPNKQPDHLGVDILPFDGKVDVVLDIGKEKWPWEDNTVESVHCSHFLEHLEPMERVHFVNELQRVLEPGGKCTLIVPHWCSTRAYGDLTHKWPPVVEMWFYYLSKDWRAANAPHNNFYTCDLEASWGYSMHQALASRNPEYQQDAMAWKKEAVQDIIATIKKKQ